MRLTDRHLAKRPASIFIAISGAALLLSCAAQGPPQPPHIEQPQAITDLRVKQVGHAMEIGFTPPQEATDGELLTKPLEIEVFRTLVIAGQVQEPASGAVTPWMTVGAADLRRSTRGQEVVLNSRFSDEEFNRWKGATFTFTATGLTHGFRNRPIISEASKPATIVLLNVSGPITHLEVIPHEKNLEVRWSPVQFSATGSGVGTLTGYNVYRSDTGAAGSFQLLVNTESTTLFDRDFEFKHTYFYKVRGVFKFQSYVAETEDSTISQITPLDVYPPEAPKDLSGIYTGQAVELIWTANTEADLTGYNVYRREDGEPARRLNKELVHTPVFRDTRVEPDHKYTYHVTAVDLTNNESQPSEETTVETR